MPGSGLLVNGNAFGPDGSDQPVEFLYQLKLGGIIDINSNNLKTSTLNGIWGTTPDNYEFTAIGRTWENIEYLDGGASTSTLSSDPTGTKPNILKIYADVYDGSGAAGSQADMASGTGFRDGVLVLEATPIELNSIFNATDINGNDVLDNQDYGTGSVFIIYQVEFFDPDFFTFSLTSAPLLIQIQFDGTLTLPPAGVETQTMWNGTVPDYYTGLSDGTTPFNTEDLLRNVDGHSHFCVFDSCDGSIGDLVWHDLNRNGIQDASEPGIPNVGVKLTGTDVDGNPVSMTDITDRNGKYLFLGLCEGTYEIEVNLATVPASFNPTTPCSSDQTIGNDSNADDTNNCTPLQTVNLSDSNTDDMTIDFGFITPDCTLMVTKTCFIPSPPSGVFECDKPIDVLTMIWDGFEVVRIKAWKGAVGKHPIGRRR